GVVGIQPGAAQVGVGVQVVLHVEPGIGCAVGVAQGVGFIGAILQVVVPGQVVVGLHGVAHIGVLAQVIHRIKQYRQAFAGRRREVVTNVERGVEHPTVWVDVLVHAVAGGRVVNGQPLVFAYR